MTILPPNRPQRTRQETEAMLAPFNIDREKYPIIAFGDRGYFLNSMGRAGKNDRSCYDDAFGIITPREYGIFNGNTDPTAPEGDITGRALLEPGFHPMWCLDLHKGQYLAFCQRKAECVVKRDNTEKIAKGTRNDWGLCLGNGRWQGWFGINGHRGGNTTTSSLGCQTTPEPQWSELIHIATVEAKHFFGDNWRGPKARTIPYVLFETKAA